MACCDGAAVGERRFLAEEAPCRVRLALVMELVQLERARAMVWGSEEEMVARRLQEAVGAATVGAVKGTHVAVRAAGRLPSVAVALAPLWKAATGTGTAAASTEGGHPVAEATMPAEAVTAAMLEEVTAMARAEGTPEAGCLPAEGTPPGA